ncbi:uncharacterized protein BDW43DRAFT_279020 [Aspergillus alliaceus]|uniref:uncharacterized protein n=1 Tax=Petromyces alliaceus TaxID=209559 RepID=UPI0012A630E6|nr:uncharacterized protein BDW43DRAFT_279020 [Aspergillus alliaceus]KAB8232594.1 hypothetical protein BDW43DRAFT_279020 [Aspergillus alliaceus]
MEHQHLRRLSCQLHRSFGRPTDHLPAGGVLTLLLGLLGDLYTRGIRLVDHIFSEWWPCNSFALCGVFIVANESFLGL